ncbi:MAG: DUF4160 domain-containing protein [Bacteroidales bacterium]|nr:DUF4160 domain-containing protein [Bacteroidales bacterium]
MPELFRMYGFLFMFFSHEHEPMHVHVIGNNGEAKFSWDGQEFVLVKSRNVKPNDLKRIARTIADNTDIIVKRWEELFG